MEEKLVPKPQNLIIRVLEHLSKFGDTQLQVCVILDQVAYKVVDDARYGFVQVPHGGGAFESTGGRVQVLVHGTHRAGAHLCHVDDGSPEGDRR